MVFLWDSVAIFLLRNNIVWIKKKQFGFDATFFWRHIYPRKL